MVDPPPLPKATRPPFPPVNKKTPPGPPAAPVKTGAATEEQKNAEAAYKDRKPDWDSISITFQKVASGEAPGDPSRAQFWLGKALFQMEYYGASLAVFQEVVEAGPEHPYYQLTLPWLASLSRVLPEGAGVLALVGKYRADSLEAEQFDGVRDELYYLLGRFNYQKGDLGQAIALLSLVPENSDFYIPLSTSWASRKPANSTALRPSPRSRTFFARTFRCATTPSSARRKRRRKT